MYLYRKIPTLKLGYLQRIPTVEGISKIVIPYSHYGNILFLNTVSSSMLKTHEGNDHTLAQRLKSREVCPLMPMALILPTILTQGAGRPP